MTAQDGGQLFQYLQDIEQRCLDHAAGLPQDEAPEESWEGVLFSMGGQVLLAPLNQVKEILNYPAVITNVPGTREWIKGVANIRGNLLPISDLQAFLLGRHTVPGRRSRVLVVNHANFYSGLLVDQMVGIRHFLPSEKLDEEVDLPESLSRFITHAYRQGGQTWPVFDLQNLAENPEFQFAAA